MLQRTAFGLASYSKIMKDTFQRTLSYKSAISLDALYPQSSIKLTTPEPPSNGTKEEFNGYIPVDQLNISYSKSSGPGGQNVNKVNTKVEVRFHLQSAKWLSPSVKTKLSEKLALKITKEGDIIFRSDLTRSQQLNLADCLEKLRNTIRQSLQEKAEPSEESQERFRKLKEKAARERLAIKRQHSRVKNDRKGLEII